MTPRSSPRSAGRRSPGSGSPGPGGSTRPPPFQQHRLHEHSRRAARVPARPAVVPGPAVAAASASSRTAAAMCCSGSQAKPSTSAGGRRPHPAAARTDQQLTFPCSLPTSWTTSPEHRDDHDQDEQSHEAPRRWCRATQLRRTPRRPLVRQAHAPARCTIGATGGFPIRRLAGSPLSSYRDSCYRVTAPRP
jgi:hypothetical protein